MAQERRGATKKRSWERGDGERRKCAHFYAQGNPICQLLRDGKLEWETIGEWFFGFFSKKKDEEEKQDTLVDTFTSFFRLNSTTKTLTMHAHSQEP